MNILFLKNIIIEAAITIKNNFWKLVIMYGILFFIITIITIIIIFIGLELLFYALGSIKAIGVISTFPAIMNGSISALPLLTSDSAGLIGIFLVGAVIAIIFLLAPLILSFYKIALCVVRKEPWNIKDILYGYTQYLRSIHLFIKNFIAVFPWISALFVLIAALIVYLYPFLQPIIIVVIIAMMAELFYKAILYSQMWFLSIDNRLATPDQALDKSKAMMKGNMWKFIALILFTMLLSLPFDIINEIFNWKSYATDTNLNPIEYWSNISYPHAIFSIIYFIVSIVISIYSIILVSVFYNTLRKNDVMVSSNE